jgi:hypothetical protein
MGSLRVFLAVSAMSFALVGACGGSASTDPPHTNGNLDCLAYPLTSFCCTGAGEPACPGDFAAAQLCTTWPAGFPVRSYPTACQGFIAVTVTAAYTTVYVYDSSSGALYAVGDDAATDQPGSLAVECGAGPEGFTIPSACALTWLDTTQGQACAAGTATPSSVCP